MTYLYRKQQEKKTHDCLTGNLNPQINYLTKISHLLCYFSTVKNEKKKIHIQKSL